MFKHTISKSGIGAARRLKRRQHEQAESRGAVASADSDRKLEALYAQLQQLTLRVEACLLQIQAQAQAAAPELLGQLQQDMLVLSQAQAQARGEAFLQQECLAGRLVPARSLQEAWNVRRPALDQRRSRGRLIGLKVKGDWHYPAGLMQLSADDAAGLCQLLGGEDAMAKYLALHETQAALGGKSLMQAAIAGDLIRAKSLALAWSEERGLATYGTTPRYAQASSRRAARNR